MPPILADHDAARPASRITNSVRPGTLSTLIVAP